MTLSGFFEKLGAPLNNPRWSWVSIRDSDGVIFCVFGRMAPEKSVANDTFGFLTKA